MTCRPGRRSATTGGVGRRAACGRRYRRPCVSASGWNAAVTRLPALPSWTAGVTAPRSVEGRMAATAARRSAVSDAVPWPAPVAPSCPPASVRPASATVTVPRSSSPGPGRTFHTCGMCGRTRAVAASTSLLGPRRPRASPCRSCGVVTAASARRGSRREHDHLRHRSSPWSRDAGWWRGRSPGRDGVADCRRTTSTYGPTRRTSSIPPRPCLSSAAPRDQPAGRPFQTPSSSCGVTVRCQVSRCPLKTVPGPRRWCPR